MYRVTLVAANGDISVAGYPPTAADGFIVGERLWGARINAADGNVIHGWFYLLI
jgi:hypothetical protein